MTHEEQQAPTLKVPVLRTWKDVSRELEEEICATFDEMNTLPQTRIFVLLSELKKMRGNDF